MERLFVYGSLKRGFLHHAEMAGAAFEGEAETATGYALYVVGDYPAMVRGGEGRVRGELFLAGWRLVRALDAFE